MLGVVTRFAGGGSVNGVYSGSLDGTGTVALFNIPSGITISSSGVIYVADRFNHLIRVISRDPCNINQVLVNGACVAVPAGFYRPANKPIDGIYYACSRGDFAIAGSSSCQPCPPLTSSDFGASSCFNIPTGQPSSQPSSQPTRQPTQPSGQPSMQPSRQPSSQPTTAPSSLHKCSVGGYVASGVCSRVPAGNNILRCFTLLFQAVSHLFCCCDVDCRLL